MTKTGTLFFLLAITILFPLYQNFSSSDLPSGVVSTGYRAGRNACAVTRQMQAETGNSNLELGSGRTHGLQNVTNLQAAVDDGMTVLRGDPATYCSECVGKRCELNYKIIIPAGDFYLTPQNAGVETTPNNPISKIKRSLDFTGLNYNSKTKTVIAGRKMILAGAGDDLTTFHSHLYSTPLNGSNVYSLVVKNMQFTQDLVDPNGNGYRSKATQGQILSLNDGGTTTTRTIDFKVDYGFPAPWQMDYNILGDCTENCTVGERYAVRYVLNQGNPLYPIYPNERDLSQPGRIGDYQVAWWTDPADIQPLPLEQYHSGNVYRIHVPALTNYLVGDLLAIRGKHGSSNAYRFLGGDSITFFHVKWIVEARGLFSNVSHVTVDGCQLVRPFDEVNGVAPMLATAAGGPQIGSPTDPNLGGHLIQNNTFVALGDDNVAIFSSTSTGVPPSTVQNNRFFEGAYRNIFIFSSAAGANLKYCTDGTTGCLAERKADPRDYSQYSYVNVINNQITRGRINFECWWAGGSLGNPACAY